MSSFEGLGPLPPLVDCDSDSDSDDEGESLQERRARWRRTLDDLAEEAEQMLLGRGGLQDKWLGRAAEAEETRLRGARVKGCKVFPPLSAQGRALPSLRTQQEPVVG